MSLQGSKVNASRSATNINRRTNDRTLRNAAVVSMLPQPKKAEMIGSSMLGGNAKLKTLMRATIASHIHRRASATSGNRSATTESIEKGVTIGRSVGATMWKNTVRPVGRGIGFCGRQALQGALYTGRSLTRPLLRRTQSARIKVGQRALILQFNTAVGSKYNKSYLSSMMQMHRMLTDYVPSDYLPPFDNPVLQQFISRTFNPLKAYHHMALFNTRTYSNMAWKRDSFRNRKEPLRVQVADVATLYNQQLSTVSMYIFNHNIFYGMEKRYGALERDVNRIVGKRCELPSPKYVNERSRHPNVWCEQTTRVIINYPNDTADDFIHANWIKGGGLFNTFIVTQAPLKNTIVDFWRMIWQFKVPYIFMLISRNNADICARYWPIDIEESMTLPDVDLQIFNTGIDKERDPLFRVTKLKLVGPNGETHLLEHWQGDMNNADNVHAPLRLLKLSRNCAQPTVVHDWLGIDRSMALIGIELMLTNLLRAHKYEYHVQGYDRGDLAQLVVQRLRRQRAFAFSDAMQYIFMHRVILWVIRPYVGGIRHYKEHYREYLNYRKRYLFSVSSKPGVVQTYRQISPPININQNNLSVAELSAASIDRRTNVAYLPGIGGRNWYQRDFEPLSPPDQRENGRR